LTRCGHEGNEVRVETILLGGGIELPCTRVCEAGLSYGVVATSELEVDNVTNLSGNDLRGEDKTSRTISISTNNDRDIDSRNKSRSDRGKGSDGGGGGELHFVESRMKKEAIESLV